MNVHNIYQGEGELGEGKSESFDSIVETKNIFLYIFRLITHELESHTLNSSTELNLR
jgi:hypothetical protein